MFGLLHVPPQCSVLKLKEVDEEHTVVSGVMMSEDHEYSNKIGIESIKLQPVD